MTDMIKKILEFVCFVQKIIFKFIFSRHLFKFYEHCSRIESLNAL